MILEKLLNNSQVGGYRREEMAIFTVGGSGGQDFLWLLPGTLNNQFLMAGYHLDVSIFCLILEMVGNNNTSI